MIYVLFGPSGSGKTTLLEQVYKEYGEKAIHKKGTTRKLRKYDDIEITSYPEGLPREIFGGEKGYIYSQYGYEYGIERLQINKAIEGNYPHFVICNDIDTVQKMRKDYGANIFVVYVRFHAPRESIEAIQKARGIDDDEIELRLSKIEFLESLYIDNGDLFDDVLHNRYSETPDELWKKMRAIMMNIGDYNREIPAKVVLFDMIDYLQKSIEDIENRRPANADKVEKGFAFIIMPMIKGDDALEDELWNIYTTIKNSASNAGYRAERVDNIAGSQTIDSKIFEYIEKAEIIVADLSYERPNCYYELGYAKALGKEMIIIAKQGTKIHFDVEHYDNFTYENARQLGRELQARFFAHRAT